MCESVGVCWENVRWFKIIYSTFRSEYDHLKCKWLSFEISTEEYQQRLVDLVKAARRKENEKPRDMFDC